MSFQSISIVIQYVLIDIDILVDYVWNLTFEWCKMVGFEKPTKVLVVKSFTFLMHELNRKNLLRSW